MAKLETDLFFFYGLWGYLKGVEKKTPETQDFEFNLPFSVAEVILTIPNASKERMFYSL